MCNVQLEGENKEVVYDERKLTDLGVVSLKLECRWLSSSASFSLEDDGRAWSASAPQCGEQM